MKIPVIREKYLGEYLYDVDDVIGEFDTDKMRIKLNRKINCRETYFEIETIVIDSGKEDFQFTDDFKVLDIIVKPKNNPAIDNNKYKELIKTISQIKLNSHLYTKDEIFETVDLAFDVFEGKKTEDKKQENNLNEKLNDYIKHFELKIVQLDKDINERLKKIEEFMEGLTPFNSNRGKLAVKRDRFEKKRKGFDTEGKPIYNVIDNRSFYENEADELLKFLNSKE